MNTLLIFFALPIATIILAIVLEKVLRCPILTAATFFAVYLIIAFAVFDASFLIYVILYTILAFITAVIAECFFSRCKCIHCNENDENNEVALSNETIQSIANSVAQILRNSNCNCGNNDTATINIRDNNGERTTWCCKRR